MRAILDTILQIITVDFFIGFGLYSTLYLLVSRFTEKPIVRKTDDEAGRLIAFTGIVFAIIWTAIVIIAYNQMPDDEHINYHNRIFGKYWFGFWLQPILWIAATQLARIKKVRRNIPLRMLISLVLIVSIARFVIIVTSFHRDYSPGSWTESSDLKITPIEIALGILTKIILFLLFTGMYYLIRTRVKKLRANFKTTWRK